ncbi:MAG: sulfatase-like hydrolase/transferase [Prolixibacteraceae bacterium]|jgi:arylsulfatase A|nr:sulfatase-like hydrolase/transferase [Prolixibacteraceae bacterium]MBT6004194.1 sulfatase-like hydrolase/transferase [Prolixibacteraceae bacterium]MBT6763451.1 sulfatase-like hydrolase/transferase [Prolixibacteraceae bacterium]MBT7000187.1 sulfatase-like hydrolase/transferase [Prolixibacteraceae bacterium]MBT7396222.1 sulfatase-like hydrolase/transferase [Prolixibacteraceae bacterium]
MKVLILTVIILITAITIFASNSENRKPNIVLLMADDMGYECLSSNGSLSHDTPFLDELGEKGIKFNYAISQPLCTPSRVKIMTGKYNYRNYKAFGYLDKNEKTFGNLLKDAGYETCVVGKWQLNGVNTNFESTEKELLKRPQHFGFDEYCLWNFMGESGYRFANPKLYQNGKELKGLENKYGPDVVSDYAIDFMERNKDKPFFLYYPMILTHSPFVPTPDSKEWKNKKLRHKNEDRFFKDMVEYTDKIVQKLVAKIEELGLSENTIFIFTADNGTHYKLTTQTVNGPFKGGKGTMPNAGSHVPMVVYNPSKIKNGFDYNELFEFSDFLPTFAEAAGIKTPDGIDGKSFYPLFSGQKQEARETVFVHYDPLKKGGNERWYGRFVRNKTYKLYNDGRFYNVSQDSREQNPISKEKLMTKENHLWEIFQAELETAPPYYFKQRDEYDE